MTESGFKIFAERLRGLHDACGHKPPGDGGIKVWWDTLKEAPEREVFDAIDEWARSKSKPPAPADIYKWACNKATDRRESAWRDQKREEAQPWSGATDTGKRALASIHAVLARGFRPPGPWWAERIMERARNGERLPYIALKWAGEVVAATTRQREPGEDREEVA